MIPSNGLWFPPCSLLHLCVWLEHLWGTRLKGSYPPDIKTSFNRWWSHAWLSQVWIVNMCSIMSDSWRPYCGSDHKILIAKFRLKIKTVGKTTRPFMYDLDQIPCDYTGKWKRELKDYIWQSSWRTMDRVSWSNEHCSWILYRRWWSKPSPRRRRNVKNQNDCLRRPDR